MQTLADDIWHRKEKTKITYFIRYFHPYSHFHIVHGLCIMPSGLHSVGGTSSFTVRVYLFEAPSPPSFLSWSVQVIV